MNLNNILDIIPSEASEAFEKKDHRRNILKSFGAKVAVAALPLAVSSVFKKAKAQTNDELHDSLNVLLTLKYVTEAFYKKALNDVLFPTPTARALFQIIQGQETNHIAMLKYVIESTGGTFVASPLVDPTGGKGSGAGPFAEAFNNTNSKKVLELAQTLEDMSVQAFKGCLVTLMVNDTMLSAVCCINTVDARHAAQIRAQRYQNGDIAVRPWVTGSSSQSENSYTIPFYQAEAQTMQLGLTIPGINGTNTTFETATQAFDETITKGNILELIDPFIIP